MNHHESVNWSDKVKSLDKTIRDEIGIEGENEAKNILIKVQTKASEPIEPAFIVGEDDLFLDLFVLHRRAQESHQPQCLRTTSKALE